VALYAAGRLWIEGLRIDEANVLLGLRVNEWVMGVVLLGAVVFLWVRRSVGREDRVEPPAADGPEIDQDRPRENA
jgi:prolipoprotein diacylglyceryltransferase